MPRKPRWYERLSKYNQQRKKTAQTKRQQLKSTTESVKTDSVNERERRSKKIEKSHTHTPYNQPNSSIINEVTGAKSEDSSSYVLARHRKQIAVYSEPNDRRKLGDLARELYPTLVTHAILSQEKSSMSAKEIIQAIMYGKEFDCLCSHYLIGASMFAQMLKKNVNFKKQHTKLGFYEHGRVGYAAEKSYAALMNAGETSCKRSSKYPFLSATPDVMHIHKNTVYYDEIKTSRNTNPSAFWNQRHLFQLFIASLIHKADCYRIIGICFDSKADEELPETIEVRYCIEVQFQFDILTTPIMVDLMCAGYTSFLESYFTHTGISYDDELYNIVKEELNCLIKKPSLQPEPSLPPISIACKCYIMGYDIAHNIKKHTENRTNTSQRDVNLVYNESKSLYKFKRSVDYHYLHHANNKEELKKHPFYRIDLNQNYRSNDPPIPFRQSVIQRTKIVIDRSNWKQFFESFMAWDQVVRMFGCEYRHEPAIKSLF